jgi:ribonuclease E
MSEEIKRRRRRTVKKSNPNGKNNSNANQNVNANEKINPVEGNDNSNQEQTGNYRQNAKQSRRKESNKMERDRKTFLESDFLADRDVVDRKMLIDADDHQTQIAVIEDGVLVEFYLSTDKDQTYVSNIYEGTVENVLPSMEAAFINIGEGQNGILYSGEVNWDTAGLDATLGITEENFKPGDKVVVQVTKDPVAHKGPRLTSQYTISGRYVVLAPHSKIIGISKKISEKERNRLKKIVSRIVPKDVGVIIRTAAAGVSEPDITADLEALVVTQQEIYSKVGQSKDPVKLYSEPGIKYRVLRDIANASFNSIEISKKSYEEIKDFIDDYFSNMKDLVSVYDESTALFEKYDIEDQLYKGLGRKVNLPSGGSLVIDRTEALTSIDVNTGKFLGEGQNLDDILAENNLEAAEEIVKQLRLRDIGGMIVIDFIDMVMKENKDKVLTRLVECMSRDHTRHQVSEITSLGLVQLTRKRRGPGLASQLEVVCDACKGTGFHHQQVSVVGAKERKKIEKKVLNTEHNENVISQISQVAQSE